MGFPVAEAVNSFRFPGGAKLTHEFRYVCNDSDDA